MLSFEHTQLNSIISHGKDEYEKAVGLDKSKFINWNQLMYLEAELNENLQLEINPLGYITLH